MKKFQSIVLPAIFSSLSIILVHQEQAQAVPCVPGTVVRDSNGNVARCDLGEDWAFAQRFFPSHTSPDVRFSCAKNQAIGFYPPVSSVSFCTLLEPINLIEGSIQTQCPAGRVIHFDEQGLLQFPNWCS